MAGESRDLKFKLGIEYDAAGLDAFRSDVDSVLAAARGASGDLDTLAASLTSVGQEGESAASVLSGFDAGGLSDAASGADELSGSLADVASGADDAGGALGGVDAGGLGDAASEADDLSGSLASLAGDADDASSSLGAIDASGLGDAASDVEALDAAVVSAAGDSEGLAGIFDRVAQAASDAGKAGSEALSGIEAKAQEAAGGAGGLLSSLGGIAGAVVGPAAVAAGAVAGVGLAAVGAGVGALAIGDSFDATYDRIQIQTGATGDQLDELKGTVKDVFANVPTDLESATTAVAGFGQAAEIVGDNVGPLSEQVLNLSRITGTDVKANTESAIDTFARWKVAVGDQSAALDTLFAASQKARVPVDQLAGSVNQNAAALQAAGLDFDESVGLITKLSAAGVDASEVMPGLSRALAGAAKDGKSTDEAFAGIVASIQGAGSEAEAKQLAFDAFGKSGIKMASAIRDGTLSLTDLKSVVGDAAGAINDTASSTDDFGQKFEVLKNKALVALEPLGMAALDLVNTFVDKLEPSLDSVIGFIGDLSSSVSNLADGDVWSFFGEIGDTLQEWTGLPVAAFFDDIGQSAQGLLDSLQGGGIGGALGSLGEQLGPVGEAVGRFVTALSAVDWGSLISSVVSFGGAFGGALLEGIKIAGPIIVDLATKISSFLFPILKTVFGFVADHSTLFLTLGGILAAIAGGPVTAVIGALVALGAAAGPVMDAFKGLQDWFASFDLGKTITELFSGIDLSTVVDVLLGPVFLIPNLITERLTGGFSIGDIVTSWFDGGELPAAIQDFKDSLPSLGDLFGGGEAAPPPIEIPPPDTRSFSERLAGLREDLATTDEWASSRGEGIRGSLLAAFNVDAGQGFEDTINEAGRAWDAFSAGFNADFKGADLLDRVGLGFSNLSNVIDDVHLGGALAPLQDALFSFSDAAGTALDPFTGAWASAKDSVDDTLASLTSSLSGAWSDIQSGIDGAWAGFQAAIQSAQDAIYDYLLGIWGQIPEDIRNDLVLIATHILDKFEEYRKTIEDKLAEAEQIVLEKFQSARDTVDEKLAELVTIVTDAFNDVKDAILGPLHEAQAELLAIWSSVSTSASNAWGQVTTAVSDGVNNALAVLSNLRSEIESRARAAWDGLVESAKSALAPLVTVVTDAIDDALAFLSGVRSDIEARAREAWDGVVTAATSALASLEAAVLDPIRETLSRIAGLAGEAKTQALAMGQAIIDGIKKAILDGRDAVVASILGVTRAFLQAVKDFFNIHSPSGLMHSLYLTGVMGGAILGILDGGPGLIAAALGVQASMVAALADGPPLRFLLVDPAAEAAALAPLIDEINRTTAALDRAKLAAHAFDPGEAGALRLAEAVTRITAAFDAFFDLDAPGSLKRTLDLLAGGGLDVNPASFLNSLGFDVSSFDELQARIDALSNEPEKQHETWQSVVKALTDDWKRFYDEQKTNLENQKKALGQDADTSDVDSQLAALETRNKAITDGLHDQGDGLDRMLDAYKRITGEQDALTQAVERANRARQQAIKDAEDEIKRRQKDAEGAEQDAHDQAMDLLDKEVKAREHAHDEEMKRLEERRVRTETSVKAAIATEETAHNARLAAITREVDAADKVNKAEDARLTKANLLLDTLEKGNALSAEQAAFLRAQGIDPDQIIKTNAGLGEAKANIDKAKASLDDLARSLAVLNGFLDKVPDELGRIQIAGGGGLLHESGKAVRDNKSAPQTISEAERAALQEGIDKGALTGSDKRIAEVALAGGVVQAKRLREVLGTLIAPQEAATEAAQKQLDAAQAILDVQKLQVDAVRDKLAADEAALKVVQDEAKTKRDLLADQIKGENDAFEKFKADQNARLAGFAAEKAQLEDEFKTWKQSIADAKELEEDRHKARMKAIDEEYALQLLRAGKTDDEVQKILDAQRERAAAIAAEAQRRFDEIMAQAEAARTPVSGAIAPGGGGQGKQPGAPAPITPPPGGGGQGKPKPPKPFAEPIPIESVFGGIDKAGDALAAGLVDPAIDRMDDLRAAAVDIAGLFAGNPGVGQFMGGGTANIDNGIHFHGDVYIDRDVAEDLGLYDVGRTGAP